MTARGGCSGLLFSARSRLIQKRLASERQVRLLGEKQVILPPVKAGLAMLFR
jgi:hypothetical protein